MAITVKRQVFAPQPRHIVVNTSIDKDDWSIRSHIPINMEEKPYPLPKYVTDEINRLKKEKLNINILKQ